MNVLVIGGGGREHALVWAVKRNPDLGRIYCAPGNAGIALDAEIAPLDVKDHAAVLSFVKEKDVALVLIGPEGPLVDGLADGLRAAGRSVFGPGRAAARLEGSKVFAKDFMRAHGIPTAESAAFSRAAEAVDYVKSTRYNPTFRVVKASGLAAGKGVTVCRDVNEVLKALDEAMVKKVFGAAGEQVVLEETLEGEELSVMALCDGKSLVPLVPSQDHKRLGDQDEGPNTGGMGAYAPVPQVTDALWRQVEDRVFAPFLEGLNKDRLDYAGVIYFGLMLTRQGPKVLEFNVRFGDPETQVILPMGDGDWIELFRKTADRRLGDVPLRRRAGAAAVVVMTARGYPGDYEKGKTIEGLEELRGKEDVLVFHAGTAARDGRIVTSGGRVLGVTGLGPDLAAARDKAYGAVRAIRFDGAHFRTDIGAKAFQTAAPGATANR